MAVANSDEEMEDGTREMYSNDEDEGGNCQENFQGNGHQCHVCGKVFVSTKGLVQHSIIHTDRKPFQCEICNKAFRFKSNLFEHRSIHSGEQPFVCPFCGKACRLKGNLKKHLKTHCRDPDEIEQAYEAVTANQSASSMPAVVSDDSGNLEYVVGIYGGESQQRTPATENRSGGPGAKMKKQKASGGKTPKKMNSAAQSVLNKVLRENENNEHAGVSNFLTQT